MMRERLRFFAVSGVTLVAFTFTAEAIVINGGNAGHDVPYVDIADIWEHVGFMDAAPGGTGVYLGYGWVLTADHVYNDTSPQYIRLNGQTYYERLGRHVRLVNTDQSLADMSLFQLQTAPPLGRLAIRIDPVPWGTDILTISTGRTQSPQLTSWDVDKQTTPWTWYETQPPGQYSGYDTTSTRLRLWGENRTLAESDPDRFATLFEQSVIGDTQAVTFDSGSPVFVKSGGQWELAGIVVSVNIEMYQTTNRAVFGNATWHYDLAGYRDQILQAITPSPGDFNADGLVDMDDLDLLLSIWNDTTVPAQWLADFDGLIDQNELNDLLAGWGEGLGDPIILDGRPLPPSGVPEPSSALLVSLLAVSVAGCRDSSRSRGR